MNDRSLLNLKPEKVFLAVASVFSFIFIFITPPFQSPDEPKHLFRAWQVSTGRFFADKRDNRVGGYLPQSISAIADSFNYLQWNDAAKTDFKKIKRALSVPLQRDKIVFKDNPYLSAYFPVVYIPQAFIIKIATLLDLHPLVILYLTRLFTAIFWIMSIHLVIKNLPVYRNLFLAVALLPMSVFINSMVSADVATNVILFFFIAFILLARFRESSTSVLILSGFVLFGIILSLTKSAYIFFIFLIFLVPSSKFKNSRQRYAFYAVYFCAILMVYVTWSVYIGLLYTPYANYHVAYRNAAELFSTVDMRRQLEFVLNHPTHFSKVLFTSVFRGFPTIMEQYIGRLGWLDTKLPSLVINAGILLITVAVFMEKEPGIRLAIRDRIIVISVSAASFLMIYFSMYLVWTPLARESILGPQGRYFIAVFPLLWMGISNFNGFVSKDKLTLLIAVASVMMLAVSAGKEFKRYYYKPPLQEYIISCNAEKVTAYKKNFVNDTILFGNGDTRSPEVARSQAYSAKLNENNPYGFTYVIRNVKYGEKVNVSVWCKGKDAAIIIAGKTSEELYSGQSIADSVDSLGWHRLSQAFTVADNPRSRVLSIYAYYFGKDSAYFDDFRIVYFKRKR